MPRIISDTHNKKIKLEYKLRFFSVLFFWLGIALFLNLIFISSSYLFLVLYEKAYALAPSTNEETTQKNNEVKNSLNQVHALSQKIVTDPDTPFVEMTNRLLEYAGTEVALASIEITKDSTITLRATALNREDVLSFEKKLKADPAFKDFSVPIESLARQKDISIQVTFTYYEN